MVEIMATAITGGQFSSEVDFSSYPGAESPKTGQILIAIDPSRGGSGNFTARVEHLIQLVRAAGQERLPSDRRYMTRDRALLLGVPISVEQIATLEQLASEHF
jgi:delta1-piperideine-2-carboxylate reductase